jgi:hypothetical protein
MGGRILLVGFPNGRFSLSRGFSGVSAFFFWGVFLGCLLAAFMWRSVFSGVSFLEVRHGSIVLVVLFSQLSCSRGYLVLAVL